MQCIDLHLHSYYSDGVFAPAELLRMAAETNLAAVAICDHDNIDAVEEALDAANRFEMDFLTGVELSTMYGEFQDLHLLGYGFDHHNPRLKQAPEGIPGLSRHT